MAEVTYYVALPFVASDDGVAAGEPTECFNPVAVVVRAEGRLIRAHCVRRYCGKNETGLRNPLKLVDAQGIEPWTSPV
jgi:hypothetical protein